MLTATLPSNVNSIPAGQSTFSALRAPRPLRRRGAHCGVLRMLDTPQDDQHQPASDFSPSPHPINATHANATPSQCSPIELLDDLKSQVPMLERQTRLNAQHHARLTALQKEHAAKLRALQQEHEEQTKELERSLHISGFEDSNFSNDLGGKAEEIDEEREDRPVGPDDDFIKAHLRTALENLYAAPFPAPPPRGQEAADATPSSAQDRQDDAADAEQDAHKAWEEKTLDEEFMRRKIFALEQLFHQKPVIRHFDPATDGMQTGYEAEIAALRMKLAEEERKKSEFNAQLSEVLSQLERVRDVRDELQQKLDRRNELEQQRKNDHHFFRYENFRSAHSPRLKVFLEELFMISCDPRAERVLKEEEERRLRGRNDGDDAARD